MSEKEKEIDQETPDASEAPLDYLGVIKNLKETTVSKELYEDLRAENARLLEAYAEGKDINIELPKEIDINELRKDLFEKDLTNLEYVSKALELRDALIKAGERDPFLPTGEHVNVTKDVHEAAERVAQVFKECVEYADGDSNLFTAELQRRTKDVMPIYGRR